MLITYPHSFESHINAYNKERSKDWWKKVGEQDNRATLDSDVRGTRHMQDFLTLQIVPQSQATGKPINTDTYIANTVINPTLSLSHLPTTVASPTPAHASTPTAMALVAAPFPSPELHSD